MYYNGMGVEKDLDKAKKLYELAAATDENAKTLLKEIEQSGNTEKQ